MSLSNTIYHKQTFTAPPLAQIQQNKVNPSLNASMIGRVHNARPGCGSCGK
jgi:hypothetical protein